MGTDICVCMYVHVCLVVVSLLNSTRLSRRLPVKFEGYFYWIREREEGGKVRMVQEMIH